MKQIQLKAGDILAGKNYKVEEWYLIQKGTIEQRFDYSCIELEANSIVGLLEDKWFICDYVAKEDSLVYVIPCKDTSDLQKLLAENASFRSLLLRSAILQRHKAFALYSKLSNKCFWLHSYAENFYNEYSSICAEFMIEERAFPRIENFEPISMRHKAEDWEIHSSNALTSKYFSEYMHLMMQDDALCVGAIAEASAQMRRVTLGIEEMVNYLLFNKDLFLADSEDDLFHLLYHLACRIHGEGKDTSHVAETLERMLSLMKKLELYSIPQLAECQRLNADYGEDTEPKKEYFDIKHTNCILHIFTYAGFSEAEAKIFQKNLEQFRQVSDKSSMDPEIYGIRKSITQTFYQVYQKAFFKSMDEPGELDVILSMFLYFGFMDVEYLGEEHVGALIGMVERLNFFKAANVYTIYDWLARIYRGEELPSRNDFDQEYRQHLIDLRRRGEITEEEQKKFEEDSLQMTIYEMDNLFTNGHRITYGRVTSFCPVLSGEEMMNSLEKMAVTAERVNAAFNELRHVDYSIFYREDVFSDPEHDLPNEKIQREI